MAAYHETHDAPHCPTCDCGVESLSRQGGGMSQVARSKLELLQSQGWAVNGLALYRNGERGLIDNLGAVHWTRASEAVDWVLVPTECTHIMEYTLSEALASGDYSIGECLNRAIAAAPASGGG